RRVAAEAGGIEKARSPLPPCADSFPRNRPVPDDDSASDQLITVVSTMAFYRFLCRRPRSPELALIARTQPDFPTVVLFGACPAGRSRAMFLRSKWAPSRRRLWWRGLPSARDKTKHFHVLQLQEHGAKCRMRRRIPVAEGPIPYPDAVVFFPRVPAGWRQPSLGRVL